MVKGGAGNPAYDTLKAKLAAACGFTLHPDGDRRKNEADGLKELRAKLEALAAELKTSKLREAGEVRALLEFAITKVDAGFARLSGADIDE